MQSINRNILRMFNAINEREQTAVFIPNYSLKWLSYSLHESRLYKSITALHHRIIIKRGDTISNIMVVYEFMFVFYELFPLVLTRVQAAY